MYLFELVFMQHLEQCTLKALSTPSSYTSSQMHKNKTLLKLFKKIEKNETFLRASYKLRVIYNKCQYYSHHLLLPGKT